MTVEAAIYYRYNIKRRQVLAIETELQRQGIDPETASDEQARMALAGVSAWESWNNELGELLKQAPS